MTNDADKRDRAVARRARKIMDDRYGVGWRNLPLLRSPEYAAAWHEAEQEIGK